MPYMKDRKKLMRLVALGSGVLLASLVLLYAVNQSLKRQPAQPLEQKTKREQVQESLQVKAPPLGIEAEERLKAGVADSLSSSPGGETDEEKKGEVLRSLQERAE